MRRYSSALSARLDMPKARYEMAFSDSDIFKIEKDTQGLFYIAMYSGKSGAFCGYY